ncbi:MAG: anthranilate synthase [Calothrix sp. C42_A2020_038]|nr:anthranilate synthase [Calothrix sp. C42_A2020_038]
MISDIYSYTTLGGVRVLRSIIEVKMDNALDDILFRLDSQRGGLLTSSYEYPGRYRRWAIGFVNPPLELVTRENNFTLTALNQRGEVLLTLFYERLSGHGEISTQLCEVVQNHKSITGKIAPATQTFSEEERSKQPSAFSVIREILHILASDEDEHLGLYGAFGYDLVFQFEPINQRLPRQEDQRDLVLYLPDELVIVDYYQQRAYRVEYELETRDGTTRGLARTGESIDYRGQRIKVTKNADHTPGEYAKLVNTALDYFRRGDLFEVVPSQSFFENCEELPSKLFQTLKQINPSPYGFIFNLGGEFLIGASPEMFVRVEGRRVETCPISGTISRGQDAIDDAGQILQLLNSYKDESELTMCTDVDRNDKSRICEPGSVRVIGRRQIELYSHLIHTVDHVEGLLRPEFDALDAFLTHTWAVTVTGAPKRWAMKFIEEHERSARRWYGGAVGWLSFNGNFNTGLILRTIRLKDTVAEVRVGATVLYDSIPQAEEQETITKAQALFETIRRSQQKEVKIITLTSNSLIDKIPNVEPGKHVLLIDYEDSFVHTLANYIRSCGATVKTLRHGFCKSVLDQERPDLVVLSPGPGKPSDFNIPETVKICIKKNIPIFGVCLGLQSIVEAFDGKLGVLDYPQHGKRSKIIIKDTSSTLFKGLPETFTVGRYHSLYADTDKLPPQLRVTAISEDDVIMAIEHQCLPIAAVQFHPESIMTLTGEVGLAIVKNIVTKYTKSPETLVTARTVRD